MNYKRKTPIRHRVRQHRRERYVVHSYMRGHGKHISLSLSYVKKKGIGYKDVNTVFPKRFRWDIGRKKVRIVTLTEKLHPKKTTIVSLEEFHKKYGDKPLFYITHAQEKRKGIGYQGFGTVEPRDAIHLEALVSPRTGAPLEPTREYGSSILYDPYAGEYVMVSVPEARLYAARQPGGLGYRSNDKWSTEEEIRQYGDAPTVTPEELRERDIGQVAREIQPPMVMGKDVFFRGSFSAPYIAKPRFTIHEEQALRTVKATLDDAWETVKAGKGSYKSIRDAYYKLKTGVQAPEYPLIRFTDHPLYGQVGRAMFWLGYGKESARLTGIQKPEAQEYLKQAVTHLKAAKQASDVITE